MERQFLLMARCPVEQVMVVYWSIAELLASCDLHTAVVLCNYHLFYSYFLSLFWLAV